jgi:transposase
MKLPVIGMDIAKHVFQLHTVDVGTGSVERTKLKRGEVVDFFSRRERSLVAIEACGGAHHWARQLQKLGHEVRLIAAHSVRPFVLRNKSDSADARGIWTAVQQPEARFVAVKSETQQSILALHGMRTQLMKFRIMQTNALRGILHEFGEILSEGYQPFAKEIVPALARISERLPAMLVTACANSGPECRRSMKILPYWSAASQMRSGTARNVGVSPRFPASDC